MHLLMDVLLLDTVMEAEPHLFPRKLLSGVLKPKNVFPGCEIPGSQTKLANFQSLTWLT